MDFSSYSVEAITRCRPLTPVNSSTKFTTTTTTTSPKQQQQQQQAQHGPAQQRATSKGNSHNPASSSTVTTTTTSTTTTSRLQRTLGLWDIIFYGVGCSVGAGIYSLVGIGAELSGPSISLSFFICGVACCFTSLSYAEFAARVPLAGSAYTFTYVSFGELSAWLVGWNLTLGYAISAAVVARSWAEYLVGFIEGWMIVLVDEEEEDDAAATISTTIWTKTNLQWLTKFPISTTFWIWFDDNDNDNNIDNDNNTDVYTCCPLSMVIIGICTIILVTGVKESTRFNTIMTILNLSILTFVLVGGIGSGSVQPTTNLSPFFPHGISGMARGAGLVFFSYLGFDMVACLSEECQDPERILPIGIVGSLAVSMTIYVSVSLVVAGMAPITLLGQDTPIVNVLLANACCTPDEQQEEVEHILLGLSSPSSSCLSYTDCADSDILHPLLYVGSRFVSFGAIFGLTTATFACLMGQPRINFAAAQDGLLFPIFAKVHPHTGVPTIGTIITGIFTAIVACFIELEYLANAISLGTLQVFSFVNAGVIILRLRGTTTTTTTTEDEDEDDLSATVTVPNNNNNILGDDDNDSNNNNMDESSPLLNVVPLHESSSSSILQDPTAAATARSLGLINISSREIRVLVHQQDNESYRDLRHCANTTTPEDSKEHDNNINHTKNNKHAILLVVLYTLSSIGAALSLSNDCHGSILVSCGVLTVVSAIFLFRQELPKAPTTPSHTTFQCPFVPAVPLLGILCNSYMMGSMPLSTWWVIVCWLLVGLLFYLVYGIHHSELRKEKQQQQQRRRR